jgi:hypothetical protein
MALRQAGLIFRAEAAATLVIAPRAGEAFRVRRIYCSNPSTTLQHCLVINDTARVGFFRIVGLGGSHLLNPRSQEVANNIRGCNLLDAFSKFYNFMGYPVVQGEALTLLLDAGTCDFFVEADSYDAADVKSSEQNGSKSPDVLFVNYGTNPAVINAVGYNKISSSRNPAEMVAFPFGAPGAGLVPAGKKVKITYIGGQAVGFWTSAGNTLGTAYLRPRVGTAPAQTIFDRNDVGFPFFGNIPASAILDYTGLRQALPSCPRSFEQYDDNTADLDFNPNDEFSIQLQTVLVGASSLAIGAVDVWVAMRVYPAS